MYVRAIRSGMDLFSHIYRLGISVLKLLVWVCVRMLTAVVLHLRKCSKHLTRLCAQRASSTSIKMATAGEEAADDKLVEKIAKNVVQNVKSKEVRHDYTCSEVVHSADCNLPFEAEGFQRLHSCNVLYSPLSQQLRHVRLLYAVSSLPL